MKEIKLIEGKKVYEISISELRIRLMEILERASNLGEVFLVMNYHKPIITIGGAGLAKIEIIQQGKEEEQVIVPSVPGDVLTLGRD